MSTDVIIPESVSNDAVDISHLDTPEKRFEHLSRSFMSSIIVIAAMRQNEDWKHLTRADGSAYGSLTQVVQDALSISDSWARRLVQTSDEFYAPLEAITVSGTVINISSTEAVSLGKDGMAEVVERAKVELPESATPEMQTDLIESIKKDAIQSRSTSPVDSADDDFDDDFGDLDFGDLDFDDDDDDDGSPSTLSAPSQASSPKPASTSKADRGGSAPKPSGQSPSDYLSPIEKAMSGGKEYTTDEDIETLPEELQEFVKVVNYLAGLDAVSLSKEITKELRGVTYSISRASNNLKLVDAAVKTSPWVLEQAI